MSFVRMYFESCIKRSFSLRDYIGDKDKIKLWELGRDDYWVRGYSVRVRASQVSDDIVVFLFSYFGVLSPYLITIC